MQTQKAKPKFQSKTSAFSFRTPFLRPSRDRIRIRFNKLHRRLDSNNVVRERIGRNL